MILLVSWWLYFLDWTLFTQRLHAGFIAQIVEQPTQLSLTYSIRLLLAMWTLVHESPTHAHNLVHSSSYPDATTVPQSCGKLMNWQGLTSPGTHSCMPCHADNYLQQACSNSTHHVCKQLLTNTLVCTCLEHIHVRFISNIQEQRKYFFCFTDS
jgi:hypothetical protein